MSLFSIALIKFYYLNRNNFKAIKKGKILWRSRKKY